MDIGVASLFVSSISALSSVVQAVKAAKGLSEFDIVRSAELEIPDTENTSALALAATGIDDEYIEIANNNIKRALDRFKQVWRDPSLPQAVKDQELEAASFVVCSELRRLKTLNGGVLPPGDFDNLWANHNCDEVKE